MMILRTSVVAQVSLPKLPFLPQAEHRTKTQICLQCHPGNTYKG